MLHNKGTTNNNHNRFHCTCVKSSKIFTVVSHFRCTYRKTYFGLLYNTFDYTEWSFIKLFTLSILPLTWCKGAHNHEYSKMSLSNAHHITQGFANWIGVDLICWMGQVRMHISGFGRESTFIARSSDDCVILCDASPLTFQDIFH